MDIKDIFSGLFVFIGLLLFIVVLHLLTINTVGDTSSVLNTVFIVFLRIFEVLLIFVGIWVIIHFLKWLVWVISTPQWLKNEMRNNAKR